MDDVTADLLISELDAMEAVDREWEDNDVSDQPAAVPTEELEARCGQECLNQPDHDGPHFYGYIMGRHSYEGIKAERDALRERVATLEGIVRALEVSVAQPDMGGHHQARTRIATRLTPEQWDVVLDASHDQEQTDE